MKSYKLLILIATILVITGCGVPPAQDDGNGSNTEDPTPTPDDVGVVTQAVTGGTAATQPSWVVGFTIDSTWFCSASVLSEHYLLTAAHCVVDPASQTPGYGSVVVTRASAPGTSQIVYSGRAMFLSHPDYENGIPLDPDDDIALVFLRDGAINLTLTGRANIYIDYENPIWTAPGMAFTFAGWGLSDPSGDAGCATSSSTILRTASGGTLWAADKDQKYMTATEGPMHPCPGDSGSPWLFTRAGNFLAFAVTTGWMIENLKAVDKATTIFPKWNWIYQASKQSGCNLTQCWEDYLDCVQMGSFGGLPFHQCFERRRSTGAPPDPSAACPAGKHCCEPGLPGSGQACQRCVANNQSCP